VEQFSKYTLPGVNKSFKSVNAVLGYLKKESQSLAVDVKSCRVDQVNNYKRDYFLNSVLIKDLDKNYDYYNNIVKKHGVKKTNNIEKSIIIYKLIQKEIFFPILIEDRFPQLKLSCLDFIMKDTYYRVILNIVNDIMPLYLKEDFSEVEFPPKLSLRRRMNGEKPKLTHLQYMAIYSESVNKYRPGFSVLDGIIRFHLGRQLKEFKESKSDTEIIELELIRAARIEDPRITQIELSKRLNILLYKIKKYLIVLNKESEVQKSTIIIHKQENTF